MARLIFDGSHLRAVLHPGSTGLLMVTFDYRRDGKADFSADAHSTGFARIGHAQLSIKTKANDWFINPDTRALEPVLAALAGQFDRVQMLGFSMGAYAAFRFAAALRARSVLAVSPQVSIDPELAPHERRYPAEAARFDPVLGDLGPVASPGLGGLILLDPFIAADLAHARALQVLFPAVRLVRLGFGGHPAFDIIRHSGQSWTLHREAMALHPDPGLIRAAHRAGRGRVPAYWQRLGAWRSGRRRPGHDLGHDLGHDRGGEFGVDGAGESP